MTDDEFEESIARLGCFMNKDGAIVSAYRTTHRGSATKFRRTRLAVLVGVFKDGSFAQAWFPLVVFHGSERNLLAYMDSQGIQCLATTKQPQNYEKRR